LGKVFVNAPTAMQVDADAQANTGLPMSKAPGSAGVGSKVR
jgi:hypothetical protein